MHRALRSIAPLGFRLPPGRGKLSPQQRSAITRRVEALKGVLADASRRPVTPRRLKGESKANYNKRLKKLKENTGTPANSKKVFVPKTQKGEKLSLTKWYAEVKSGKARYRAYIIPQNTIRQMEMFPDMADMILHGETDIAYNDKRYKYYSLGGKRFESLDDIAESMAKVKDWYVNNLAEASIKAYYV